MSLLTLAKRGPATPALMRDWSTAAQFAFVESLPLMTGWSARDVAFHGGTSLNMSWKSPRYSEDLDFLLEGGRAGDTRKMDAIMKKTAARIQEVMSMSWPGVQIEIKNKTRDDNPLVNYQLLVSHPNVLGKTTVKVEFWPVDQDYLARYQTEMVLPVRYGDVVTRSSSPLPAATLTAAFADKLTALATRPHLKWRDLFDLWWIGKQISPDVEDLAERFLHHIQAFAPYGGLAPAQALGTWVDRHSEGAVIDQADPDLRKWLPKPLWDSLSPDGVIQIVSYVRRIVAEVSAACDRFVVGENNDESSDSADRRNLPRMRA